MAATSPPDALSRFERTIDAEQKIEPKDWMPDASTART
jgi:hypothetical protein